MSGSFSTYCERLAKKQNTYSPEKFNVVKRTLKFKKAKETAEGLLKEAKVGVCQCCGNCRNYRWISEMGGGADYKACTKLGLSRVEEMNSCGLWTKAAERMPRLKMKVDDEVVAATLIARECGDI